MEDDVEYVEYEVPLLWGCWMIIGGLICFAAVILILVAFLM